MNAAKREISTLLDGLVRLIHVAAAILAVRIFIELSDPTNKHPAALILLGIVAIGLADLILAWPLRRISNAIRSNTLA